MVIGELDKFSVVIAKGDLERSEADIAEKYRMSRHLRGLIALHGKVDAVEVDLDNEMVAVWQGSSIFELHAPLVALVKELVGLSSVKLKLDALKIPEAFNAAVTQDAGLLIYAGGNPGVQLPLAIEGSEEERLRGVLGECAAQTGGYVRSNNKASLAQWLSFYELDVPKTVGECEMLAEFLEFVLPEASALGNYWAQLNGEDEFSVILTAEEKNQIKAFTATQLNNGSTLLDQVFVDAGSPRNVELAEAVNAMLLHASTQRLAVGYVKALGWYGANAGEQIGSTELGQIIVTAIILEIESKSETTNKRNFICGYDLYQVTNVDLHPEVIIKSFGEHLVGSCQVSRNTVDLAAYIMLADVAPEFLVREFDRSVSVGSTAWLNFCRAVSTIELINQGTARLMEARQVEAFGLLEPQSEAMRELQTTALIDPILDWGLINGLITHQDLIKDAQDALDLVVDEYQSLIMLTVQAAVILQRPLADKQLIALELLKEKLPGCNFLEDKLLVEEHEPNNYGLSDFPHTEIIRDVDQLLFPVRRSLVEVYASDELESGRWDLEDEPGIYTQFEAEMSTLPAIKEQIFQLVVHWHDGLQRALETTTKLALTKIPAADREVFLNSDITVFTLRETVSFYQARQSSTSGGYAGSSAPEKTKLVETQKERDEAVGRYGVVICALNKANELLCYEILTLQGECHRNDRLAGLIKRSNKMNVGSRFEFSGDLNASTPAAGKGDIATDLRCYTHGRKYSANAQSVGVIEKYAVLPKIERDAEFTGSSVMSFNDIQLHGIAEFIILFHPPISFDQALKAAMVPTPLEKLREKNEQLTEFILNSVIPFRGCIADLASGDKSRVAGGVYGCIMDVIALLGTVVGAASKILSVVARSVSTASKAASLVKFAAITLVSVFNPADGFGHMALTGSKLLSRSGAQLGRNGLHVLKRARFQLRTTMGRVKSFDLPQVNDYAKLGRGVWRPAGKASNALNIRAVRNGADCFAAYRSGRAWGAKLKNIEFSHAMRALKQPRKLPPVYTRNIIKQALPKARGKIDNALRTLGQKTDPFHTDLASGLLFGGSAQGRDNMLQFLKLLKTDCYGFSINSCLIDAVKDDRRTMVVNSAQFDAWRKAGRPDTDPQQFLELFGENLQEHFYKEKLSLDVIADDLIYVLSRADSKFDTLASASRTQASSADAYELDVAPLLNLAQGNIKIPPNSKPRGQSIAVLNVSGIFRGSATEKTNGKYDSSRSLKNADTHALMALLLDQASGEYSWQFKRNVETMKNAVADAQDGIVTGEVLLSFTR